LITAGGENVAPVPIEESVKKELACISNAVLIGDKKKFLTMFLTFKVSIDENLEMPTNKLTKAGVDWCRYSGSQLMGSFWDRAKLIPIID
jgi:long-chain-fatty-acid--CoA ligase ACSBG